MHYKTKIRPPGIREPGIWPEETRKEPVCKKERPMQKARETRQPKQKTRQREETMQTAYAKIGRLKLEDRQENDFFA